MTSRSVRVTNQLGLHARAAARFVNLATRFTSHVTVGRDSTVMDGKSIMGILLLAAGRGTSLTITAEGPDEAGAVAALPGANTRLSVSTESRPCNAPNAASTSTRRAPPAQHAHRLPDAPRPRSTRAGRWTVLSSL